MPENIKEILEKIEALNTDLKTRYEEMSKKYGYTIEKHVVRFQELIRQRNKKNRIPSWKYVIPKNFRHILSIPFIYGMIIPAIILDIFISIYHTVAFSLYRIPKVKRSDYIIFERQYLDYLNWIEKIHCLYCSYMNGLFAYSVEIAARTERYWCPIKAASKPRFSHGWYKEFADYGSTTEWKEKSKDHENAFIDSFGDKVCIPGKNQKE